MECLGLVPGKHLNKLQLLLPAAAEPWCHPHPTKSSCALHQAPLTRCSGFRSQGCLGFRLSGGCRNPKYPIAWKDLRLKSAVPLGSCAPESTQSCRVHDPYCSVVKPRTPLTGAQRLAPGESPDMSCLCDPMARRPARNKEGRKGGASDVGAWKEGLGPREDLSRRVDGVL